ncbi:MAG: hypothetical protein ABNH49_04550 [Hyphomonas sp.]
MPVIQVFRTGVSFPIVLPFCAKRHLYFGLNDITLRIGKTARASPMLCEYPISRSVAVLFHQAMIGLRTANASDELQIIPLLGDPDTAQARRDNQSDRVASEQDIIHVFAEVEVVAL